MRGQLPLLRGWGFTLLELVLAITIVGASGGVLLHQLAYYEELAEKAQMEAAIASFRNALRVRLATLMVEGRMQDYPALAGSNPVTWLEEAPGNYAGVLRAGKGDEAVAGNWYFDETDRALVYVVRAGAHFRPDIAGRKEVRLRVDVRTGPAPELGQAQLDPGATIRLQVATPYHWFEDDSS